MEGNKGEEKAYHVPRLLQHLPYQDPFGLMGEEEEEEEEEEGGRGGGSRGSLEWGGRGGGGGGQLD
jgi:hypothetical protein